MASSCRHPEAEASGLVQTLQGHVDDIRTLIQCGICIRPLYEPFTLACGHTFCYSCLTSWFSGGRKKRTCPDCRADVKTQPTPAYLVRAIVQMFTSRAELLDKGETTQEHSKNQKEEAHRVDEDRANPHASGGLFGGLFRPKDSIPKPIFDIDDGVMRCPHCSWELEEGTTCGGCGYEHRLDEETDVSQMGDDTGSELDGLLSGSDDSDFMANNPELWGGSAAHHPSRPLQRHADLVIPRTAQEFLNRLVAGALPNPNRSAWRPTPPHYRGSNQIGNGSAYGEYVNSEEEEEEEDDDDDDEEEEEEDDENEYDEADSFIDDEYSGPPTSSFVDHGHDTSGEVYDLQYSDDSTGTVMDEDHGDDLNYTGELHQRDVTPYADGIPNDSEVNDSEEAGALSSDSEEDVRPRQRRPPQTSRRPQFEAPSQASWLTARGSVIPSSHEAVASSEVSSSSPEPPLLRPSRTTGRRTDAGTSAGTAISLDDSDDDQPVGPVRRNTQRRRNRFSPY